MRIRFFYPAEKTKDQSKYPIFETESSELPVPCRKDIVMFPIVDFLGFPLNHKGWNSDTFEFFIVEDIVINYANNSYDVYVIGGNNPEI